MIIAGRIYKNLIKTCIAILFLLSLYTFWHGSTLIRISKERHVATSAKNSVAIALGAETSEKQTTTALQLETGVTRSLPVASTRALIRQKATEKTHGISRTQTNCTARNNVFFLKTHKTAGTSVQNILFRYGLKHNLIFAMPVNQHDFNYPYIFNRKSVYRTPSWNKFNIMAQHIRVNYNEVRAVMPPDTFFFSIIREPGSHFESCYEFFRDVSGPFRRVPAKTTPEYWLSHAHLLFNKTGRYWGLAKNLNTFDFGYDNLNETAAYLQNTMAEISRRYDLVLIADHYDESMVLLGDALCWPIQDLACLTLNARSQGQVDDVRRDKIKMLARKWNKADAALFDHFNKTLWRKIEAYGRERMSKSIAELQKARENLIETCVEGGTQVPMEEVKDKKMLNMLFVPKHVTVSAYNLKMQPGKETFCRHLVLPEIPFSKKIFAKQRQTVISNAPRRLSKVQVGKPLPRLVKKPTLAPTNVTNSTQLNV